MGGAALHLGNIAEMKTGEGKTLVATLPGLPQRARPARACTSSRSTTTWPSATSELMGRVHRFLGLEVGVILANDDARRSAASSTPCDITYGTNNEFGFDYLRDNMAWSRDELRPARPQLRDRRRGRLDPHRRGPHAADHQRPGRPGRRSGTPSSPASCSGSSSDGDYEVDEKKRTVGILERGVEKVED